MITGDKIRNYDFTSRGYDMISCNNEVKFETTTSKVEVTS